MSETRDPIPTPSVPAPPQTPKGDAEDFIFSSYEEPNVSQR